MYIPYSQRKVNISLHIKTVLNVMDFLLILGILYIFNIKTQVQRRAITFKSVCIYFILKGKSILHRLGL